MLNRLCDKGYSIDLRARKLEQVPRDLHDVFNRLISRETEALEECTTLLQWVLFSFRPLTPYELVTAIEASLVSQEDLRRSLNTENHELLVADMARQRIIDYSRGLVELTTESAEPVVQFIHSTIQDFLLGRDNAGRGDANQTSDHDFTANFQADMCHATMADTCLRYLTALGSSSTSSRCRIGHDFLARYAAKYWWQHVQAAGGRISENILTLATELCLMKGKLLMWIQHHNIDRLQLEHAGYTLIIHTTALSTPLCPPLYYAALIGFARLVSTIVSTGADINAVGGRFRTALGAASWNGQGSVVQILLDAGADVHDQGSRYGTALYGSSNGGRKNVVWMLLNAGANVNVRSG